MKQRIKQWSAVLLSLTLILTLLPAVARAEETPATYLVLGDSISAGYKPATGNLEHPFTGYLKDLYAFDMKGVSADEGEALAYSGWTTQDLMEHLNSRSSDTFTGARLVTITIGGNDLMHALYGYLFEEYQKTYPDTYKDKNAFQDALLSGTNIGLVLFALQNLEGFNNSAVSADALQTAESNLSSILNTLEQKAPDAIVVVATQYNPYNSFANNQILGGMYKAFETGVRKLNEKIESVCAERSVPVADVYNAYKDRTDLSNAAIGDGGSYQLDFHPNEAGHKVMAQTFARTIDTALKSDNSGLKPQADVKSMNPLTYGDTPASADITLVNNSLLPVTVTGVTCVDSSHFEISKKNASAAIAPGASAVVGTWTPVADLDANQYTTSVTVSFTASYPGKAADLGLDAAITGSAEGSLSLQVNPVSLAGAQVSVNETCIYTGQTQTPGVVVSLGGKPLTPNKDYTLDYTNNVHAGNAGIAISGTGNYTGSAGGNFTIQPAVLTLKSVTGAEKEYDGKKEGGSAAITFDGLKETDVLTPDTDYTVAVEFSDPGAGTGKSGTAAVTLKSTAVTANYTFQDGNTAEISFGDGKITKAVYDGTTTAAGMIGKGESYAMKLPVLPAGAVYGQPVSSNSRVIDLSVKDGTLSYTGDGNVAEGDVYTVTVPVTGADNYKDYNVEITLTGLKILDPATDQIKVNIDANIPKDVLTETGYRTADDLKSAMSRVLMKIAGYQAGNAVCYDVTLQYSTNGGATWIDALPENFPSKGITVTLPYPEGTNSKDYDFRVVHMFAETSARLNTKAGEMETPAVTKTESGLQVTFRGLSPVTVGWVKTAVETGKASSGSSTSSASSVSSGRGKANAASKAKAKAQPWTGDSGRVLLWAGMALLSLLVLAGDLVYIGKRKRR